VYEGAVAVVPQLRAALRPASSLLHRTPIPQRFWWRRR